MAFPTDADLDAAIAAETTYTGTLTSASVGKTFTVVFTFAPLLG